KQATAIQEITTIRQGMKSGEEHVQIFKQSYMRSGYGEIVGIHKFKRSLNTPLLDKLMAVPNLLTTLEGWYKLTIWLDRQWWQAVAEKKTFAAQSGKGETSQNTQQANPLVGNTWQARDPNAMEVDRNRSQHRCYNCGQVSHFAHNC
ncbi:hypothetical protein AMATHDRAFT_120292, partial [Amanita thiersii Skay4041]